MTSVSFEFITPCKLMGTPRVTRPAPAFNAAVPVRTAAPAILGDPAITKAFPNVPL